VYISPLVFCYRTIERGVISSSLDGRVTEGMRSSQHTSCATFPFNEEDLSIPPRPSSAFHSTERVLPLLVRVLPLGEARPSSHLWVLSLALCEARRTSRKVNPVRSGHPFHLRHLNDDAHALSTDNSTSMDQRPGAL
jgi:hypothetical protein